MQAPDTIPSNPHVPTRAALALPIVRGYQIERYTTIEDALVYPSHSRRQKHGSHELAQCVQCAAECMPATWYEMNYAGCAQRPSHPRQIERDSV